MNKSQNDAVLNSVERVDNGLEQNHYIVPSSASPHCGIDGESNHTGLTRTEFEMHK